MIKYDIEGGNLPVVICYPEAGQTICSESGAMSWMSPNMNMDTNTGGGIKKMIGRMFTGESLFMNEYTPMGGDDPWLAVHHGTFFRDDHERVRTFLPPLYLHSPRADPTFHLRW